MYSAEPDWSCQFVTVWKYFPFRCARVLFFFCSVCHHWDGRSGIPVALLKEDYAITAVVRFRVGVCFCRIVIRLCFFTLGLLSLFFVRKNLGFEPEQFRLFRFVPKLAALIGFSCTFRFKLVRMLLRSNVKRGLSIYYLLKCGIEWIGQKCSLGSSQKSRYSDTL